LKINRVDCDRIFSPGFGGKDNRQQTEAAIPVAKLFSAGRVSGLMTRADRAEAKDLKRDKPRITGRVSVQASNV
jgi:hypothetical protein